MDADRKRVPGTLDLDHSELANDLFEQNLGLFRETRDHRGEAIALASLGEARRILDQPDLAPHHLGMALEIRRSGADRYGEAFTLIRMARTYQAMTLPVEALQHFDLALTTQRTIGDRWGQAETFASAGQTRLALGDTAGPEAAWHHRGTTLRAIPDVAVDTTSKRRGAR